MLYIFALIVKLVKVDLFGICRLNPGYFLLPQRTNICKSIFSDYIFKIVLNENLKIKEFELNQPGVTMAGVLAEKDLIM